MTTNEGKKNCLFNYINKSFSKIIYLTRTNKKGEKHILVPTFSADSRFSP